ncbi:hypothetical protein D3C81_1546480 [compost metagenome]
MQREENRGEEMLLYHSGLQSAITLSGSRGLCRGLDLLADVRQETDDTKQAKLSPSKLLSHATNYSSSHAITMVTGALSPQLVDTALQLHEMGRKLEIWCAGDGMKRAEGANEAARLRKFGIPVLMLNDDSEKVHISRKGDDVKHVIA